MINFDLETIPHNIWLPGIYRMDNGHHFHLICGISKIVVTKLFTGEC